MNGQELQKQKKAVLAVSGFLLLTIILATSNAYSQAESPDPLNIDALGPLNVIEIRHYVQQEGQRQNFIDYFEEHFIVSQEEQGMAILGQLRVIDKPNETVWVRAFENMQSRSRGLKGFYFGPVWATVLRLMAFRPPHNVARKLTTLNMTNSMRSYASHAINTANRDVITPSTIGFVKFTPLETRMQT